VVKDGIVMQKFTRNCNILKHEMKLGNQNSKGNCLAVAMYYLHCFFEAQTENYTDVMTALMEDEEGALRIEAAVNPAIRDFLATDAAVYREVDAGGDPSLLSAKDRTQNLDFISVQQEMRERSVLDAGDYDIFGASDDEIEDESIGYLEHGVFTASAEQLGYWLNLLKPREGSICTLNTERHGAHAFAIARDDAQFTLVDLSSDTAVPRPFSEASGLAEELQKYANAILTYRTIGVSDRALQWEEYEGLARMESETFEQAQSLAKAYGALHNESKYARCIMPVRKRVEDIYTVYRILKETGCFKPEQMKALGMKFLLDTIPRLASDPDTDESIIQFLAYVERNMPMADTLLQMQMQKLKGIVEGEADVARIKSKVTALLGEPQFRMVGTLPLRRHSGGTTSPVGIADLPSRPGTSARRSSL
jgi:hypothetical protein